MTTANWKKFDYERKSDTAPDKSLWHTELWIVETFYDEGVTIGYYDGHTFRTSGGSDDCHVSHWAEIDIPDMPDEEDDEVQAP